MKKNLMRKKINLFLSSTFIFLIHLPFIFAKSKSDNPYTSPKKFQQVSAAFKNTLGATSKIYDSLKLSSLGLTAEAFHYAVQGFYYLLAEGKLKNDKIISIADFSLSSCKKRLFILDLENHKLLFNTYVAHGKNSGRDFATEFSNENESYKSSLGFYVTQDTYTGNHGYSLRLEGEEKGINDNANSRAIVMHSAWYVNENIVKSQGYIGRSQGCPALPDELCKPIIEKIKKGSCLFIYSPDKRYLSNSRILRKLEAA